jgi:UDP:flavonoid glycosyltransferase YjiC (YdhE family)
MRILFATTRGAGHFGPLTPFAHACLRAGHDVLVAGPPSIAPLVARAGFPFRAVAEAPADVVEAGFAPVWAGSAAAAHVIQDLFIGLHACTALPDMLAAIEQWRPDVVVRETMEFASAVAADRYGVPQVRVGVHLASATDSAGWLEDLAAPALDELGGSLQPIRESPLLTLAPRSLNDAAASEPEGLLRFRTPVPARQASDGEPLVYASFGSEAPASKHFPGVYRNAVDALAGLPVRGLVTIGDRRDPAELGPLPPTVRVERWVSQAEVMPRAAAMVGHGGSGSTLAALAAGVPQAFIPLFVDGPANARRVAELGAGLVAGDLAADLRALLEDPFYRRGAAAIADEIRALPPVEDAIEIFARQSSQARTGVRRYYRSAAGHAIR